MIIICSLNSYLGSVRITYRHQLLVIKCREVIIFKLQVIQPGYVLHSNKIPDVCNGDGCTSIGFTIYILLCHIYLDRHIRLLSIQIIVMGFEKVYVASLQNYLECLHLDSFSLLLYC